MKSKPNHLASKSERSVAYHAIPQTLLTQYQAHLALTELLHQSLQGLIDETVISQCQAVRYAQGELIISTPSLTLANHLRYLNESLIQALQKHTELETLTKLTIVQLGAG